MHDYVSPQVIYNFNPTVERSRPLIVKKVVSVMLIRTIFYSYLSNEKRFIFKNYSRRRILICAIDADGNETSTLSLLQIGSQFSFYCLKIERMQLLILLGFAATGNRWKFKTLHRMVIEIRAPFLAYVLLKIGPLNAKNSSHILPTFKQ